MSDFSQLWIISLFMMTGMFAVVLVFQILILTKGWTKHYTKNIEYICWIGFAVLFGATFFGLFMNLAYWFTAESYSKALPDLGLFQLAWPVIGTIVLFVAAKPSKETLISNSNLAGSGGSGVAIKKNKSSKETVVSD